MVLSYPGLPLDLLGGRGLRRKLFCRTFSDCTTAPRAGLPSGCYPLDSFYKESGLADRLRQAKGRGRLVRAVKLGVRRLPMDIS